MAGASRQETVRGRADFEVDRIEAADGRLTVAGRWTGVRGMRFMRPTLVLGDRQLLAVLEHKPWAPDADPWVAAFPWDGAEVDPDAMALSVAPSVMVPLGVDREVATTDEPAAPDEEALAVQRLQAEVRFLRDERRENQAAVMDRDDLDRARREAERERANASAQLEEAIADREAAVRTRARMEAQRDEAEAARQRAEAERDDAMRHLAELRAHLDQVLLANRELQQQLQAQLAAAQPEPTAVAPPPRRPVPRDDDEQPIGVRAIPAARAVSPHLHRSQRARDVGASPFDVWAIRVLGTVAAICFILLLVMFIRLFV